MSLHDDLLKTVNFDNDDYSIYESLLSALRSCQSFRNCGCCSCSVNVCRLNDVYIVYDNLLFSS